MRKFTQDPNARLDYKFNLGRGRNGEAANLEDGETIVSYSLTVDPGIIDDGESATDTEITVWLRGGTLSQEYEIVCEWTTSLGRTDVDRVLVRIAQE